ncbi:MAG TPA: thiamine phosphate synthase [Acidimicrobiales bacterium]
MPAVPRLVVVTDRHQAAAAGHGLLEVVAAAVEAGARAVWVREKDLPAAERSALAVEIARLLALHAEPASHAEPALHAEPAPETGSRLPVSGAGSWLVGPSWVGVHVPSGGARPPGFAGRSCHSVEELRAARDEGFDYATLSPVFPSASKPGYGPALGLGGLRHAVAAVPDLPVLALGGVTAATAAACVEAGAAGVAVMGAVMAAADPPAAVRDLLAALGETVSP